MKQGSSGLTLREYKAYHQSAFELTPKKVTHWVENLPMANLGDSSMGSYRLLVDINQSLLDPDKRLTIINTLEPIASELITSLEKQYLNSHIAFTEKQKKVAALVQAIQTEIAIGYHSVIESVLSDDIKRSNKKLLLTSLVMAMKYHGLVILRCYQLYTSIPKRIWKELYCLYLIAQKHEMENQVISLEHSDQSTSVYDSLLQTLLLSIANPYQLQQRETELLWKLLPQLTQHVSLKSHAYNKQHYVIELNASSPPIHKSLYVPNENKNNLKLTVFTAIEQLKHMLSSISDKDQQSVRKSMLLRHLIQTWNHGTHRAFARTPCQDTLEISIGLAATHYLLLQKNKVHKKNNQNANNTLDAMEGSLKDATLLDVAQKRESNTKNNFNYLSSSGAPNADVWKKLYQTEAEKENAQPEPQNRSRDSIVRDSYKYQKVDLLNMSPNGFCIQISSDALPKHAQTGEILGFLEKDKQEREHSSVGVVRWVRRQTKSNLVQMGIQLLAPGVTPIKIKRRNSRDTHNDFYRGLMLPALTGIGQPATLLTNPLYFAINNKVQILEHGEKYDARLSKEITSTGNYRQFSFEKNEPPNSSRRQNDPSIDSPDINGIWDIF